MKRITLLFIMSLALSANAQKFTAGMQLSYVQMRLKGSINTGTEYRPYYERIDMKAKGFILNGTVGYNPRFYKFNSDLSLGGSFNIGVGYFFAPKLEGINGSLTLDFPEYITLRYGRHATDDSKKNIGFAFGAGYDYTYSRLPFRGISIMGEICFERMALRLNSNITKFTYYSYYTSEGAQPAFTLIPFGVQVLVKY